MWCVPSSRPRATVSLLLALRDEGRVPGAGQRVRRTREGRAIDRGSGPALRVVLPAGRRGASASARRNLGDDSRVIVDLPLSPARKVRFLVKILLHRVAQALRPDFVEHIVVPRTLAQHDLEFLRGGRGRGRGAGGGGPDGGGWEAPRPEEEVAAAPLPDPRGGGVAPPEQSPRGGAPPVRFPDSDHMSLLFQVLLDFRKPVAELG